MFWKEEFVLNTGEEAHIPAGDQPVTALVGSSTTPNLRNANSGGLMGEWG